jgi:hypothetical protein
MIWLIFLIIILLCILYLVIDFLSNDANANTFQDRWIKKLVWLWLPFYAFNALIKEIIKKK